MTRFLASSAWPKAALATVMASLLMFVTQTWAVVDPYQPAIVGSFVTGGHARDLAVVGDLVFASDGNDGLRIFDVSDPTEPILIGTWDTPGFASDVVVVGDFAYVADGTEGLRVVNVSNPTMPTNAGSASVPFFARGVTVRGDHAFVAHSDIDPRDPKDSFIILDISNPGPPLPVASVPLPNFPIGSTLVGDLAFVAGAPGGLHVIDISDLSNPFEIGGFPTVDYNRSVAVSGAYAFLGTGVDGLNIVDISDPTMPTLRANYDTPVYAFGVALDGPYTYVSDSEGGLLIFDTSDVSNPVLIAGPIDTPGKSLGIAVVGNYVYIADGPGGLQIVIIDSSEPTAVLISHFEVAAFDEGVRIEWDISHADDLGGFHIYRSLESEQGFVRVNQDLVLPSAGNRFIDRDVKPGETYWYRLGAIDRDGEFFSAVQSVTIPSELAALHQNQPNPFNPSTVITYRLTQAEHVTLDIYDVNGTRVRTLVDRRQLAGPQSASWDGRDQNGTRVASGVYFYRLTTQDFQQTRKMTLVE